MAFFNGMDGAVAWVAGYDTGVKAFTVTDEIDIGKYVNWDSVDNYEDALAGARRWSGTITADFDNATALPDPGTSGATTLRAASATQTWSGTIMLERITNEVAMTSDVTEVTFDFIGSGTCTQSDGT